MKLTTEQKIERLKAWASANYENGADTFVECYGDADWQRILTEQGTYTKALAFCKSLAAIYRERQADARIEGAL